MSQLLNSASLSERQLDILHRLVDAATQRHAGAGKPPIQVLVDDAGVKVRGDHQGESLVLEEYTWNSKQDMLVRVLYRVANAVFGEDAIIATCNSQELAERCIASLFKTDMLNTYELYVLKVYTNKLSPFSTRIGDD
jgi:hypothetical protein